MHKNTQKSFTWLVMNVQSGSKFPETPASHTPGMNDGSFKSVQNSFKTVQIVFKLVHFPFKLVQIRPPENHSRSYSCNANRLGTPTGWCTELRPRALPCGSGLGFGMEGEAHSARADSFEYDDLVAHKLFHSAAEPDLGEDAGRIGAGLWSRPAGHRRRA